MSLHLDVPESDKKHEREGRKGLFAWNINKSTAIRFAVNQVFNGIFLYSL